jgi:hypothetical protein
MTSMSATATNSKSESETSSLIPRTVPRNPSMGITQIKTLIGTELESTIVTSISDCDFNIFGVSV